MAFSATVDKVNEAYHFLVLMYVAELPEETGNVPARLHGEAAFRFALSAFLTATRSVLHLLQEEGARVSGFTRWYVSARDRLMKDGGAAYFIEPHHYRVLFPNGPLDVSLPPDTLAQHAIGPLTAARLPDIHVQPHVSRVSFADRPEFAATELCARYLESLTALVRQASGLA